MTRNLLVVGAFSLVLCAGAFVAGGGEPQGDGVRIAVIQDPDSAEIQTLGELLEVELSRDPTFQVLDRSRVDRIFAEHELQLVFDTDGVGARRKLGQLLRADLLVFLRKDSAEGHQSLFVSVADVRSGLRLTRMVFPADMKAEEGVALCMKIVGRALDKWQEPLGQIVAVMPFLSRDLGQQYAHLSESYRWIAESILEQFPGYHVVEWGEARAYLSEMQLSPSQGELFQHPLPWFISGEYRNEGMGEDRTVTMRLLFKRGKEKKMTQPITISANQAGSMLEKVLRSRLLSIVERPSTVQRNAFSEATDYWTRAHHFMDLGQYRTALSLFEAALLVAPRDKQIDFNGWVYSVDRHVKEFSVTLPDILYCKLIQVISLILRQGQPTDDSALAMAYLGEWMRSPITAHRNSPRYFYQLKDAAIRSGAGVQGAFARSRAIYELFEWMDIDPSRRVYAPKSFRDRALDYYWLPPNLFHDPALTMSYARNLGRIYRFLLKHPHGKDKIWGSCARYLFYRKYPAALREEIIRQITEIMSPKESRVFNALLPVEMRIRGKSHLVNDDPRQWQELMQRVRPDMEKLTIAIKDLYGKDLTPQLRQFWDPPGGEDGLLQLCREVISQMPRRYEPVASAPMIEPGKEYANFGIRVAGTLPPNVKPLLWSDQMRIEPYDIVNNWGWAVSNAPVLELTRVPIQLLPSLRKTIRNCGVSNWRKMPAGVDVVIQQGHLVQVMKQKDELLDLYDAWDDTPGSQVLDAIYDGRFFWVFQVDAQTNEFSIIVLNQQGRETGRLKSPKGVPFCRQGRAEPLSPGRTLWAGYAAEKGIAQTWLAVLTIESSGMAVDVFHEAKSQWGSVSRRTMDRGVTEIAFIPDCLKVFQKDGVPMAVVGNRYGRFLLLDCQQRKVVRMLPKFKSHSESEYISDDRSIVCFDRNNMMRRLSLETLEVESRAYRKRDDSLESQQYYSGFFGTDILFGKLDLFRPEERVHYVYCLPQAPPYLPLRFFSSNFYDALIYNRTPDALYAMSYNGVLHKGDSSIFIERPEWQKIFERHGGKLIEVK